jgi:hypothetical protein
MQELLTPAQEAEARELAARITEAIADDVLQVARLLVGKTPKDTFGPTEVRLRDLAHTLGARALELSLAQKKTATSAPA